MKNETIWRNFTPPPIWLAARSYNHQPVDLQRRLPGVRKRCVPSAREFDSVFENYVCKYTAQGPLKIRLKTIARH